MNTSTRFQVASMPWAFAVLALLPAASCSESSARSADAQKPAVATSPAESELAAYRADLLELAFESASAFPLNPHIKNRSRAQEAVVSACLELDQPQRALRYTERIANWRRGKCYADIAYHQAERGRLARVQEYLDLAQKIADGSGLEAPESASDASVEMPQEWRRDRIRAGIARTYVLLGQSERATQVAAGAVGSEIAPIHAETAKRVEPAAFDDTLKALDALVAPGEFESLRSALAAYAQLFGRFYADSERRALVESKIQVAWAKLPIQVRLEVQTQLVEHALAHDDAAKALELLDAARAMLALTRWTAEANVPLAAQLAALRYRAGDREQARADLDAALAAFEKERETIVNIYRAGVLRPVAEAYQAMGDTAKARVVYAQALEEGVLNPNSRPRAEDLAATATSMAVQAVEPDAKMLARLKEIRAKLGNPW